MKHSRKVSWSALAAFSAASLLSTGCMEFEDEPVVLQQHVTDWREEIIYQVLVDRFADGDWGNNYSIYPSAPGKWHGGDWKGLESKLDYLDELGVTTLWISPVVKNVYTDAGFDAYHGYWAQDLTQPAPQFGDLVALRSLVRSAHERNMKVILDIVTNHMGQLFFYDINGNGQADDPLSISKPPTPNVYKENEYDPTYDVRGVQASTSLGESGLAPIIFAHDPGSNHMPPFPEIFQNPLAYNRKGRTYNFDDPDQLVRGDFPGGLKDVNTELCPIRLAMVDSYARWIELTDIDGLRIDTVKHVERGFWRVFSQMVRKRLADKGKTNFFMFGEAFDGRDDLVGSYTKNGGDYSPDPAELAAESECAGMPITSDQLDSVFYFPQQFQVIRDVFRYRGPTTNVRKLWDQKPTNYGLTGANLGPTNAAGQTISPQHLLVNFLDNHDVPRFLFTGAGNYPEDPIFGTALDFQTRTNMLHNALSFLFTEDGIPCVYYGTEQGFQGGNDPGNREDMWGVDNPYDMNAQTFLHIRKLSAIRKKFPALTKGDVKVTWESDRTGDNGPDANILAYERTGGDAGDSYALVVINANIKNEGKTEFGGTPMTIAAPPGTTTLVDVLGDGSTTFPVTNNTVTVTVPALRSVILIPQQQL